MEILFWIWVLTWLVKTAATDVLYAWSGKPNPRYELKKARARAAGQPVDGQPRYGTREWASDLWSDALAANTARRRGRQVTSGPVDDMLDAADVRASRERRTTPAPAVRDEDTEGTPVVHDDQHPYCVTACSPECTAAKTVHGWRCPWCHAFMEGFATEAEARADGAGHTCATTEPDSTTPGEQPTLATVIPMFPNLKEILMSDTTTEVIGLDQSIGYTKALANFAGTHGSAGNEGYIGVLTKAKVAGNGLTTAHRMQEAFDLARAAAEAHATELEKQKTIQEAYDANPDAGDKDYMQQGR